MTKIRGIIFDMDGVLIDARDWHYEALNRALALFGHGISRNAHQSEFDGLPTRDKLIRLNISHDLPASLHEFINRMKQVYTLQMVAERCHPVTDHQLALINLKDQGYQLAVASNSIRASVDTMLKKAELQAYLDFTLSNEDVKRGKPHPEIYHQAIARMKLMPQECVVIEDNPHGIAAATAAGAHVLCVKSPVEVKISNINNFISMCDGIMRHNPFGKNGPHKVQVVKYVAQL
ncbi:HAD family hydrolase [Pantoea sp. Lu_F5_004]|uniref:HAD family hydrolase n=1 Tax=Pantoea sp. Lu_F5_004 TaxID=3443507 RepID=UPI003EB80756